MAEEKKESLTTWKEKNVEEKLLTPNEFSRSKRMLKEVRAIVLHWTGSPMQKANATWNYFEKTCPEKRHFSSAHYIIDLDGHVLHCVPDIEVAYHCGSSQLDPESGKLYTDWARAVIGEKYCNANNSPNNATIGIELCTINNDGDFSDETMDSAKRLVANLLYKHKLPINRIGTHHGVCGWKDCPKLWTLHPDQFEIFRADVGGVIK
jgi:N-acetylmuramoyl-L-alanine amidase